MNPLVYHIASGQIFFTGVVLFLLAIALALKPSPIWSRVAMWAFLLGVGVIAISSTALPYWCYAIVAVGLVVWAVALWKRRRVPVASLAFAAAVLTAAGMEARHHLLPRLQQMPAASVAVIGDSMTAGYGGSDRSTRWPDVLAKRHGVSVQKLAAMGATAASAVRMVEEEPIQAPLVLVEIGGNDLLGGTPPEKFATHLDKLLAAVSAPGRQVVMFELPLPPLKDRWGRIQRELAAKHGVALVPKRALLSVIGDEVTTVDSVHLTQTGHDRMAAIVWEMLGTAVPSSKGR